MNKNTILECYTKMLTESTVKLDKEIENLLIKFVPKIETIKNVPPENPNITSCTITDEVGKLEITDINGRVNRLKVGKALRKLYPGIDVVKDPIVQKLILELKLLSTNSEKDELEKYGVYVEIDDDIVKWYKKCADNGITSCVTGAETTLYKAFNKDPNIHIAVLFDKKTNEPIGRALLWHNVEVVGEKVFKTYLDRTYPAENSNIKEIYTVWAKLNNYLFRSNLSYNANEIISGEKKKIRFRFSETPQEIKDLPYMDTFKNLYESKQYGNLIGTNYTTANKNWYGNNTRTVIG